MGVPAKGNFGLARVLDAADAAGNVSAGVANTTGWQKLQIPQVSQAGVLLTSTPPDRHGPGRCMPPHVLRFRCQAVRWELALAMC